MTRSRWRIPFTGLRFRIAASYAALLLVIIALLAISLNLAFRTILFDQARARIDHTAAEIAQVASRSDPLLIGGAEGGAIESEITNPSNLDHWSSPTTYVQIDNGDGYPIGKSSNLGAVTLLPATDLSASMPKRYRVEHTAIGPLLVVDERVPAAGPNGAMVVHVAESLALINTTVTRSRLLLALAVVISIPVVLIASTLVARNAIRPIDDLTAAMQQVGRDRLDQRLPWSNRPDELGELARTYNAMLDRLEEAFARERQFISDASHELKTPLTVINANAQMLQRWADRDPQIRSESLAAIADESASLARMVNGMLTLAKADAGDSVPKEPIVLASLVAETVRAAAPRASEKGLTLRFTDRSDGRRGIVSGEANLLRQLFMNLIDNAIKFTERGTIDVTVEPVAPSEREVAVEVADTGIGIDEASLGRVFDRFYRTDKSRSRAVEGTGLGLAIARSIASVHDGRVEARRSPEGNGTTMRVTLPVTAVEASDSVISSS